MPIFLAVRITRHAISPRLAIRILSNYGVRTQPQVIHRLTVRPKHLTNPKEVFLFVNVESIVLNSRRVQAVWTHARAKSLDQSTRQNALPPITEDFIFFLNQRTSGIVRQWVLFDSEWKKMLPALCCFFEKCTQCIFCVSNVCFSMWLILNVCARRYQSLRLNTSLSASI
jgi:hypothetical protein